MSAQTLTPPLPAWVDALRPRTEAEAMAVRRQVEHIRASHSILYGERLAPLATVGEAVARNAHWEHFAISSALARLDFDGVQDETQAGAQ
jgi:hypothetical protein